MLTQEHKDFLPHTYRHFFDLSGYDSHDGASTMLLALPPSLSTSSNDLDLYSPIKHRRCYTESASVPSHAQLSRPRIPSASSHFFHQFSADHAMLQDPGCSPRREPFLSYILCCGGPRFLFDRLPSQLFASSLLKWPAS